VAETQQYLTLCRQADSFKVKKYGQRTVFARWSYFSAQWRTTANTTPHPMSEIDIHKLTQHHV